MEAHSLHRKVAEMQKQRKEAEKTLNLLSIKIKILEEEEYRAQRANEAKRLRDQKLLNHKQTMKEFVNRLSEIKEKKQMDISIKKEINKKLKNELKEQLENKKEINLKKHKDIAANLKMTQKMNDELRKQIKQERANINKARLVPIKESREFLKDKIKGSEENNKKMILSTYEMTLNEEERIKKELEIKINQLEKLEVDMVSRLKQIGRLPKIALSKA